MAYWKMEDKPRNLPWCFEYRNGNGQKRRKFCATEKEAKEAQETYNTDKRRSGLGLISTIDKLSKYRVRDIINWYRGTKPLELLVEVVEPGQVPKNYDKVFQKFSNLPICELKLHEFTQRVAENYIEERLDGYCTTENNTKTIKPLQPSTVKREVAEIQQAWKWARKNLPNLEDLTNPWAGIVIHGSTGKRLKRGLRTGELDKLLEACEKHLDVKNRYYVPLAIKLVIETGMRREEFISLKWEDIDFDRKTIRIKESKTDWSTGRKGRVIALPINAEGSLGVLFKFLSKFGKLPNEEETFVGKPVMSDPIFPMTEQAITQAFYDVKRQAKLPHITFRSTLRTTANMMFHKAKLDEEERDIMMGHEGTKKTGSRFYRDDEEFLPDIRKKLEILVFGKTEKEWLEDLEQKAADMADETIFVTREGVTKVYKFRDYQLRDMVEETINTSPPS